MKLLKDWAFLSLSLAILLVACDVPISAGPNVAKLAPTTVSNQVLKPVPLGLKPLPCTPPIPAIGQVSSYCANQIKGVGGATFSDYTDLSAGGSSSSWLVGDSINGNVSCTLDQGTSTATCTGPQKGAFEGTVCTSCGQYGGGNPTASFVCASGYTADGQGDCYAVDQNKNSPSYWCPVGSHYDNSLQNCVDNVTNKLASLCPADHPNYSPYNHLCWDKAEMAFNCQTFAFQLGACVSPNQIKVPINAVPFCQDKSANRGAVNFTFDAGSILLIDVKGDHLEGCSPVGTQPVTCWGRAGMNFNVQLCTDAGNPSTCTIYNEELGACAQEHKDELAPAPAPTTCAHC